MATSFPGALDELNNPAPSDGLIGHASQHANANDAIEALQAKVGINGSADASSLDYKATQAVAHAADSGNPHGTTAAQVGAIPTSDKGAVSGVAPLDATGKIPASYLPSYVDDVLEYANVASFPVTGETGKIYIALDTNKVYRWSGSAYIYITSGAVDSVAGKTGVVTLVKGDVGLGNVDNTSDANKPISTATQTALNAKQATIPTGTTSQYYRGDKSWADFFTDVRAATLPGLSTATNAVVAATDTVLAAIGKLQAQVSAKFDKTGGDVNGNINFTGTGRRITGDFSNANFANRVMLQSSTTNANTEIGILPNGVASSAGIWAFNNGSDLNNTAFLRSYINSATDVRFESGRIGVYSFLPMTFHTGGSERMRVDTSGNALVNLSTPRVFNNGVVTPTVQVGGTGTGASMGITRFTETADAPARIILARSGSGTLGTDAVVPSNTSIGVVDFQGYDGSAYIVRANIRGHVDGAVGSENIPTAIVLSTGATALQERLRIDSSGNVLVTSPAGLGYGYGAGGTVEQATNKSTAVTLNKPTGQITMNNAALAAGASVVFTVNNSLVTTSDLVVVGGTNAGVDPLNYRIETARANGNGVFAIRVTNISAGSLSEALQIKFAIIKGATA